MILDANGERVSNGISFQNNNVDFEKILTKFKELSITPDNSIAGLEATGNNWENLYCFFTDKGFRVIVLNPHQTNKFREALRKKAKTDDIDAFVIAGLLRSNEGMVSENKDHNAVASFTAPVNSRMPEYRYLSIPMKQALMAISVSIPLKNYLRGCFYNKRASGIDALLFFAPRPY